MAELIPAGGFKGDAAHPVTGDPEHPRALMTRGWVRQLLGLPPEAEIVAHPIRDPDTSKPDGHIFAQKAAAAHAAGLLANLRASMLCGHLLYGPAIRTTPADPIEWRPGA